MAPLSDRFDPYAEWLGIAPEQRPLNHYLLLGLPRLESNAARITAAADERMARIRQFQHGPKAVHSQRILNELAAARVCLLEPAAKASYDAWLTAMLPGAAPMARVLGIAPANTLLPPPIPAAPIAPPLPAADSQTLEVESAPGATRWGLLGVLLLGLLLATGVALRYRSPAVTKTRAVSSNAMNSKEETDGLDQTEESETESPAMRRAVVLQQEADGAINFTPATAVLEGKVELAVAGTEYVLINWSSPDDVVHWKFRLLEPAIFTVEVEYRADEQTAGSTISITVGEEEKKLTTRAPAQANEPVTDTLFLRVGRSGEHVLTLRGTERRGKEYCILHGIRIVPPKKEPAAPAQVESEDPTVR